MKTDRELIEAAAKVAGLHLGHWDEQIGVWVYPFKSELTDSHWWNPLADDGDALRLAVKLQMNVCILDRSVRVLAIGRRAVYEDGNTDAAAVRRAIVRAAAEKAA